MPRMIHKAGQLVGDDMVTDDVPEGDALRDDNLLHVGPNAEPMYPSWVAMQTLVGKTQE